MKYFISLLIITLFIACGPVDKQAKLNELKSQKKQLNAQIAKLENELKDAGRVLPEKNKNAAVVTVEEVSKKPFRHYINVQGEVSSDKNVTLTAMQAGTVMNVYVKEGESVRKGQLLAQIDDAIIRKSIDQVQNGLELATTLYQKQKNLWEQNIGTEVQYLQAKNRKESLERKLATLKEKLELTRIVAPFSGIIDAVMIKEGQVAAPGRPAIRIINSSDFELTAEIAENYIAQVKHGDEVYVEFPNIDKSITATIDNISKVINPINRTFTIKVNLPDSLDNILKINMVAYLRILDYENTDAVTIPINAIHFSTSGPDQVFVAVKDITKLKNIKIGKIYQGKAEVISGLQAGDLIITAGHKNLVDGQAIRFQAYKNSMVEAQK